MQKLELLIRLETLLSVQLYLVKEINQINKQIKLMEDL